MEQTKDYNVNNEINNKDQLNQNLNQNKKKKSLKKIFFIVALLFVSGAGFYYFEKNRNDDDNIQPKNFFSEIKNDSFEGVVDFIISNEDEIYNDSQKRYDNLNTKDIKIINYLNCMAVTQNDEKYYTGAENYINSLKFISQEQKEEYLSYINRKKTFKDEDPYFKLIANNQTDELCKNNLFEDKCLEGVISQNDLSQIHCKELCKYIEYATNDKAFFEKGVIEPYWFYNFSNDDSLTYDTMKVELNMNFLHPWRIALAYRIGGEKSVYDICSVWFTDSKQQTVCKNLVKANIENFKGNYSCEGRLWGIKSSILNKAQFNEEDNEL
jgi:hypothetical protein